MADGFVECLAGGLLESVRRTGVLLDQGDCERPHQQGSGGERDQCAVPTEMRNQPLRDRQHRELTERPRRCGDAEHHTASLGRVRAAEHARNDAERDAGKPNADQHYVLIRRVQGPGRQIGVLSADAAAALNAPDSPANDLERLSVTAFRQWRSATTGTDHSAGLLRRSEFRQPWGAEVDQSFSVTDNTPARSDPPGQVTLSADWEH